jgi:RNA polymerase sigma-70 factor, ECF subfamily
MISATNVYTRPDTQVDEDVVLIKEAKRDPTAFTAVYRKYLDQVFYYILARVSDRTEAEDLTAQVFLEALEGLPSYREDGSFQAWLFTIARRRAVDFYRRSKPEIELQVAQEKQDLDQDMLADLLHSEDLSSLQRLVGGLNEDERELLDLRIAAGLRFSDMATVLNRKESAVKMSYYRLLSRLKNQLEA